jgi:hypothetical protein
LFIPAPEPTPEQKAAETARGAALFEEALGQAMRATPMRAKGAEAKGGAFEAFERALRET